MEMPLLPPLLMPSAGLPITWVTQREASKVSSGSGGGMHVSAPLPLIVFCRVTHQMGNPVEGGRVTTCGTCSDNGWWGNASSPTSAASASNASHWVTSDRLRHDHPSDGQPSGRWPQ